MTTPDILPHLGDLILLALFIVSAFSGGLALWLQDNRIRDLEKGREADKNAIRALEERVAFCEMPELTRWAVQRQRADLHKRMMNGVAGRGEGDKI